MHIWLGAFLENLVEGAGPSFALSGLQVLAEVRGGGECTIHLASLRSIARRAREETAQLLLIRHSDRHELARFLLSLIYNWNGHICKNLKELIMRYLNFEI